MYCLLPLAVYLAQARHLVVMGTAPVANAVTGAQLTLRLEAEAASIEEVQKRLAKAVAGL
jgi:hypothetical protein